MLDGATTLPPENTEAQNQAFCGPVGITGVLPLAR
jgi:hypothetical protein